MTRRVVSFAALPAPVAEILGNTVEYVAPESGSFSDAEFLERARDADGIITLLTQRVDDSVLADMPALRVVANYAVGFDNIDVDAATRRGVWVCNTPDVLTEATADLTFALMLGVARRVVEGDAMVRGGGWTGWEPSQHLGLPVYGQTLGIVGLGRIGMAVARRARGFGMKVIYSGSQPKAEARDVDGEYVEQNELFRRADIVTLHCPLTPTTERIVNRETLALMPDHAILINTARGGCVDEIALADALEAAEIAGAGLDVFAEEPTVPQALRSNPRTLLAPHVGSATTNTRRAMGELCASAVRAVLDGQVPKNAVNNRELGGELP